MPEPQISIGQNSMEIALKLPVQLSAAQTSELEMVTGAALEEVGKPDPKRPSLIIKRVGRTGLWEIAKGADSTMEAIRKANNLEEDPQPGTLLLIPVSG